MIKGSDVVDEIKGMSTASDTNVAEGYKFIEDVTVFDSKDIDHFIFNI